MTVWIVQGKGIIVIVEMPSYVITLEQNALIDLIVPCLESAVVPFPGDRRAKKQSENDSFEGYEVTGRLWGSRGTDVMGRTLFAIRRATLVKQTRSDSNSVELNSASEDVKGLLFSTFWPDLQPLGSFHSHPYMNLTRAEVNRLGGHEPSGQDTQIFSSTKNDQIHLIVTLCRKQAGRGVMPGWVDKSRNNIDWSCIGFGLGDVFIWIRACIWDLEEGEGPGGGLVPMERLMLYCTGVTGLLLPIGADAVPFRAFGAP